MLSHFKADYVFKSMFMNLTSPENFDSVEMKKPELQPRVYNKSILSLSILLSIENLHFFGNTEFFYV